MNSTTQAAEAVASVLNPMLYTVAAAVGAVAITMAIFLLLSVLILSGRLTWTRMERAVLIPLLLRNPKIQNDKQLPPRITSYLERAQARRLVERI